MPHAPGCCFVTRNNWAVSPILGCAAMWRLGRWKPRGEHRGVRYGKPLEYVVARAWIGCRGQRNPRHARDRPGPTDGAPVLRPELMSPLRYTMRLVDREQCHLHARQPFQCVVAEQTLGRKIEKIEPTLHQIAANGPRLRGIELRCRAPAATPAWRSAATWSSM